MICHFYGEVTQDCDFLPAGRLYFLLDVHTLIKSAAMLGRPVWQGTERGPPAKTQRGTKVLILRGHKKLNPDNKHMTLEVDPLQLNPEMPIVWVTP